LTCYHPLRRCRRGGVAGLHGGGGRWSVLILAVILYMAAVVAFAHAVARD